MSFGVIVATVIPARIRLFDGCFHLSHLFAIERRLPLPIHPKFCHSHGHSDREGVPEFIREGEPVNGVSESHVVHIKLAGLLLHGTCGLPPALERYTLRSPHKVLAAPRYRNPSDSHGTGTDFCRGVRHQRKPVYTNFQKCQALRTSTADLATPIAKSPFSKCRFQ